MATAPGYRTNHMCSIAEAVPTSPGQKEAVAPDNVVMNSNPDGGAPIIGMGTNKDGDAVYCCGFQDGGNTSTCSDGAAPFTLGNGDIIFGRAALAETTNPPSASPTPCPVGRDSSHITTAVGAGVGVPLGVIALSAIAWAFFERRRRSTMVKNMSNSSTPFYPETQSTYPEVRASRPPAELDHASPSIQEIGQSEK
ncbi:hypothetical protein FE257_000074 [Aspergillus nanangensis]|uniref:Uncharacterized protein n=1 Tax=Aspergillus nanangensis TaxID=2582783 RepID=A0AAD4D0P4_ASPNN|nr:hypothetical protein FE257_000074 [Aspergillus nanangensis]